MDGAVQKNDPYHLGSWITYLRPYTFKTNTFEMTKPEAMAMLHFLEQEVKKHHRNVFTEEDKTLLDELATKIDNAAVEVAPGAKDEVNPQPFFVKLASRSAKDIVFTSSKFTDLLRSMMTQYSDIPPLSELKPDDLESYYHGDHNNDFISANKQMIAFVRSSVKVLETFSGKEAIQTFIHSRRTYGDLKQRELLGDEFSMEICLREWERKLVPEMEFRGFVYGHKFTCLTQYYCMIYSPEINKNKKDIETKVLAYWETIKHLFPIPDYCIDFCLYEDQIRVIEINPVAPLAGSGLFLWPQDRKIIENGPFEFRVVTEIPKHAVSKALIHAPARDLMNNMFPNYHALETHLLEKEKEKQLADAKAKAAQEEEDSVEETEGLGLGMIGIGVVAVAVVIVGVMWYKNKK